MNNRTYYECGVVLFQFVCGHQLAESPFIHCAGVFLKQRRTDERLEDEPTAKVDTEGISVSQEVK